MELQRMYQTILENMNEVVYVRDLDMNILYINPASERLTGWSLPEALGRKCYEVFGDEDLACKEACPVNKAISEGLHVVHHEGELKTRSGDVRDTRVSISPLFEGEAVIGVVVVMEDVTGHREVEQTKVKTLIALEREIDERKRAEEKLRESEERYRFLAENMADIIWTLDRNFKTTYVSPSVEKVLGFTPEERKRQTLEEMVTPESYQGVMAMFLDELGRDEEQGADPERSVTTETEYYHRDGSTVWIENSVKALRDQAGAIVGMYGSSRDITERKRAEEALKRSESRFREMAELLPTVIAETDLDLRITYVNEVGLRTFGYSAADIESGLSAMDLLPADEREKVAGRTKALLGGGKPEPVEYRMLNKDGSELVAIVNSAPVLDHGQVIGIRTTVQDITKRKRAEQDRERLIHELQEALDRVKTLKGLIPICANCKKIRDDEGFWHQVEAYVRDHSEAEFSHGICPECKKELYPEIFNNE